MNTPWHFFAIAATSAPGFTWQWQKRANRTLTSGHFDFYFDCVSDARANGYTGPLPSGPKVPLDRLPDLPVQATALSAMPQPSRTRSGPTVITISPMSKAEIGKRKPAGSRVR